MATRKSRLDDARETAARIRSAIGGEIRLARTSAGSSLRDAGARAGMSHTQFRRIELGGVDGVSVDQLSRACASVGLKLIAKAVPGAGPAVDAGQLALLERLRKVLPVGTPIWTEVPLPIPGDLRAWDAIVPLDRRVAVEAETRLGDIQALDRRSQLKRRDGGVEILILLVSDTANNRGILDAHREALRSTFPLDGRQILPALRDGKAPATSGILVL